MNPEKDKEFDRNMSQLIRLLNKILKNLPSQGPYASLPFQGKEPHINLNFCFFTFLPLTPEALEEWEEIYDSYGFQDGKSDGEISIDLSPADIDFLRKNGIRF